MNIYLVTTNPSRFKALTQVLNVWNLDLEFEYLKISVQSCKNTTKCASQDTLDKEILENGSFKLKLFPVNKVEHQSN